MQETQVNDFNQRIKTLNQLFRGQTAYIGNFLNEKNLSYKLLRRGISPGSKITVVAKTIFKGHITIQHDRGLTMAVRLEDAKNIPVTLMIHKDASNSI